MVRWMQTRKQGKQLKLIRMKCFSVVSVSIQWLQHVSGHFSSIQQFVQMLFRFNVPGKWSSGCGKGWKKWVESEGEILLVHVLSFWRPTLCFQFLVIMPPSALDQLTRLNIEYPMLFKLTNNKKSRTTHAGVLEFVADEGKIYIPYWVSDHQSLALIW